MRTHTKTFHIRFTEKEYERLCQYAAKAGLPKTTYIRHMINGNRPKERPDMDYFQFMREIYRLGNNLNQLIYLSHRFGSIQAVKLDELRKQINELILCITQRMIAPDKLDISATLERGRLLAEKEQSGEESDHALQ